MNIEFKQEINNILFNIIRSYIDNQIPFFLVVHTDDDLKRLTAKNEPIVILGIQEWTLETASYNIEDNTININITFGETPTLLVFTPNDITAILNLEGIKVFTKPFIARDIPLLEKNLLESVIHICTDGILHSLNKFKEFNPALDLETIKKNFNCKKVK